MMCAFDDSKKQLLSYFYDVDGEVGGHVSDTVMALIN